MVTKQILEQEAQQEQTLAEIKAIRNGGEYPREYYREAIDKALVLIHSQAQKIVELERENLYLKRQADIHNTLMADGAKFILENKAKIAEQAKQIERLKSAHKIPCVHCDSTGGFNVESTGEIITCERCGGAGYHLLTTDSKEVAR
jgi:predicted methyltransferase